MTRGALPVRMRAALVLTLVLALAPLGAASTIRCTSLTDAKREVPQTGHVVHVFAMQCRGGATFAQDHVRGNVSDAGGRVLVVDATATRTGDREGAHAFNWTVVAYARPLGNATLWYASARDAEGYTRCSLSGFALMPTGRTLFSTGPMPACAPQDVLLP